MATATARAPQPGNEEGRPVAGRPSGNFEVCNGIGDSAQIDAAQRFVIVPPIIALHWFRPELAEIAHG